ncbi:hypothetical protein SteCoe_29544 [Stentor coeruleus]|uniref:PPM-type phosphatase domain-containing protein n=1 Tax=Stentor coeruleus TaxID=5963 RepID=A0A1R2B5P8_9CILI|nr:hypothetical protein SteCoe_29544 [Stentor coeruleus]
MGSCAIQRVKQNAIIKSSTKFHTKKENSPLTPDLNLNFEICTTETAHLQPYVNFFFEVKGLIPSSKEEPFSEKPLKFIGNKAKDLCSGENIGLTCRKGLNDHMNQDNLTIVSKPPYLFAGVFDGHGDSGHIISEQVCRFLPQILLEDIEMSVDPIDCIKNSFAKTQDSIKRKCAEINIDCEYSGCTATVILITQNSMFTCHLGDSRAVLLKKYQNKLISVPLTTDHKASDPIEKSRILRNGGNIGKIHGTEIERVFESKDSNQGLAITRAFGDTAFTKIGVVSEPYVKEHRITSDNEFVVICSDGVWEFVKNYEVAKVLEVNKSEMAANALAKLAWNRWIEETQDIVDDITVLIIPL